jgi:hypothetical protein
MSGFATDLRTEECWKNQSVVLWAFGHTHFSAVTLSTSWERTLSRTKKAIIRLTEKGLR